LLLLNVKREPRLRFCELIHRLAAFLSHLVGLCEVLRDPELSLLSMLFLLMLLLLASL
jgi:hypothetical protein